MPYNIEQCAPKLAFIYPRTLMYSPHLTFAFSRNHLLAKISWAKLNYHNEQAKTRNQIALFVDSPRNKWQQAIKLHYRSRPHSSTCGSQLQTSPKLKIFFYRWTEPEESNYVCSTAFIFTSLYFRTYQSYEIKLQRSFTLYATYETKY